MQWRQTNNTSKARQTTNKTVWRGNQSAKLAEVSNLAHQKTKTRKRGNLTVKQEAVRTRCGGDRSLGRLWKFQRSASRQLLGTRSTTMPHVGTINNMMDVLNETIVLKGGRLNLNGTRETAKVKINRITSTILKDITKTSTTRSLPIRRKRRPRNRSGLGRCRLNRGGVD